MDLERTVKSRSLPYILFSVGVLVSFPFLLSQPPGKPPQSIQPITMPPRPLGAITIQTAHAPGTNPSTTITAVAGPLTCTLRNLAYAAVAVSCSTGDVVGAVDDVEPGFNLRPVEAHFEGGGSLIRWELSQKIVGVIGYKVSANGFVRAGTF